MFEKTIGHKNIQTFLSARTQTQSLSHAYLFVGPKHIGKTHVAKALAAQLLQIPQTKIPVTPDIMIVQQEQDGKTGKTKKDISIEQMHRLTSFISQSAYLGGYKVAIIREAEKMNKSASNALLKALEEPSKQTIIIVCTHDDSRIMPTIKSRAQHLHFHPARQDELIAGLQTRGVEDERAQEIAAAAHGLPGLALSWSEDVAVWEAHTEEVERFRSLLGASFHDKLKMIDPLFGDKTDHIAARENLGRVLGIWQLTLRDLFFQQEKKIAPNVVLDIFKKIDHARALLQKNIHPRLLVEQILIALP